MPPDQNRKKGGKEDLEDLSFFFIRGSGFSYFFSAIGPGVGGLNSDPSLTIDGF
jgi:hypothetical protein